MSGPEMLDGVVDVGLVEQDGGGADPLRQVEQLVQGRLAQVGVDQRDPLAGLGEGDGEVGGHRRLAVGGRRRGDDAAEALAVDAEEGEVGAQLAERLGGGGAGLLGNRDRLLVPP